MKGIAFEGVGKVAKRDFPDPSAGPGEIILRVYYCGICETDCWIYRTGNVAEPGMILGHMGGGEVVDVGSEVDGWKIGDRAAVDPRVYCGECVACRGGHSSMCRQRLEGNLGVFIGVNAYRDRGHEQPYHGLLAEYCAVPAYSCYRLPDTITDHASSAIEGVAFAVRCIRNSGIRLGDDVVIFGGADYCLDWLQWARMIGARRIAVVEPSRPRREMAQRFGADLTVDPNDTDPAAAIRRLMPFGADVVGLYPCYPRAAQHAYEVVRPRGRVQVLIAYEGEHFHQDTPLLPVMKEITISYPGLFEAEPWRGGRDRGDFALAVELLAQGKLDVESYVTRIVPWEEADRLGELAFDRLPHQEVKVRVQISGT